MRGDCQSTGYFVIGARRGFVGGLEVVRLGTRLIWMQITVLGSHSEGVGAVFIPGDEGLALKVANVAQCVHHVNPGSWLALYESSSSNVTD